MDERIKKQLAFSLEIDKVKNILRQTHISGHGRRENDAEHSWHMAVMAYLLREYAKGCAGVSPESHKRALEAMKVCQIKMIDD